jgi:NitT/TauT family transport system permease protein
MATTLTNSRPVPSSTTWNETPFAPPTLRERWTEARPAVISLCVGIALWEIIGRTAQFAFLPPLSEVLQATLRLFQSGEILNNLAASFSALAIGYCLAVVFGVPLGLVMARSRCVNDTLAPFIHALLAVPSLLFVPIFFGLFGVSRITQIAVVFIYTFVLIVIMAESGFRQVNAGYLEMGRAFGARPSQVWRRIILPNALPTLMAGLRLGMGRAIRAMINGEMVIVLIGLGALLRQYGNRFDAASVYGILLVIVGIALTLDFIIRRLDRKLNHWLE